MSFQEAENQFRWLESQLAAGQLSLDQYRAALNQLRVTDPQGRVWMLQERTGQWHAFDGQRWVPASPYPPGAAPMQPPAAPMPAPVAPMPTQARRGGNKTALYVTIWAVVFVAVGVGLYIAVGRQQPLVLVAVGIVGLISLVSMLFSLSSHWQGQVVDIRSERVRVRHGDHAHYQQQTFAYIRQSDGRTRKVRAARDWQVGMWLEKRKGDMRVYRVG